MLIGFNSTYAADGDVILHETFDDANGTGGNDNQWSGSIAGSGYSKSGWTFAKPYKGDRCVKLATGSAIGSITTPSQSFENGKTYTIIFRAGAWQGDATALKVIYKVSTETTLASSVSLTQSEFKVYSYTFTATGAGTIKIETTGKKRCFVDDIMIVEGSKVKVTIASSGWSSMTTPVGLDFSGVEGLTAYKVSSVTASAVNLASVDEAAGATGLLLNGTGGTTYSIPIKATATAVTSNELSAAYSATPAAADALYILKSGQLCLVNAAGSNVPAGKSYLLASKVPSSARDLTFNFEESTTAINQVERETINHDGYYDLLGRKVANPSKGLYIVNGKKVIIK